MRIYRYVIFLIAYVQEINSPMLPFTYKNLCVAQNPLKCVLNIFFMFVTSVN